MHKPFRVNVDLTRGFTLVVIKPPKIGIRRVEGDDLKYELWSNDNELGETTASGLSHQEFRMQTDNDFIDDVIIVLIFSAIVFCCFVCNASVIIIVIMRSVLHTPTSYFILSLSVADLLVGVTMLVLALPKLLNAPLTVGADMIGCKLPPYLELACVTASIYSLLCISLDRYRTIVLARRTGGTKRMPILFACIWIASLIYASKVFLQVKLHTPSNYDNDLDDGNAIQTWDYNDGEGAIGRSTSLPSQSNQVLSSPSSNDGIVTGDTFCSLLVEEDEDDLPFRIVDLLILFLLPCTVMIYVFLAIRRRLWGSNISVTTNVRKKRSVIRFLVVDIIVFIICWLPFYSMDIITDTIKLFEGEEFEENLERNRSYIVLRFMFIVLAFSNSFLNPIIYAYFNKNFNYEARQILSRLFPCAKNQVAPIVTTDETAESLKEPGHGIAGSKTLNADSSADLHQNTSQSAIISSGRLRIEPAYLSPSSRPAIPASTTSLA